MQVKKHLDLLGFEVSDRVTGFKGIAASICFDLYGCILVCVTPKADEDGKISDGKWFDIARLKRTDENASPVMDVPNFEFGHVAEGKQGCAEKPDGYRY